MTRTEQLNGIRVGILFTLLFSVVADSAAQRASLLRERIEAIADGADSAARRLAITNYLKASGIDYKLDEFTIQRFTGTNIMADVPGKKATKTLLLGAHYDRVTMGNGAVDNAASCAALLALLSEFKANPLENYSVRAVFFDLEEQGLIGSQAYFARAKESGLPNLAMNLDILGYGDTFFVHPSLEGGALATALQQAASEFAMPVRSIAARNQYPASDHRIMMAAGIETLAIALIDGSEIDSIVQKTESRPRILTIIHTREDTIDKIRPEDIEKAFSVLHRMIRLIDT